MGRTDDRHPGSDAPILEALAHVRGPALAGTSRQEWSHGERLRTEIPSLMSDIAHELTRRALDEGDLRLARWATGRGLEIDPGSEPLMVLRLQAEHRAGNTAEVERLTQQIHDQARQLGLDLHDDTLSTL
ncbi:hypothetical protein GCM10027418_07330 [Mariniluteicoccus endophyticus]